MHQFALLATRRFAGIFWTQFIGAFTDGFYKNALLLLVVYEGFTMAGLTDEQVGLLASALFILPFFVVSATAGQLADKLEKAELVRFLKTLEIGFTLLAAVGLYLKNVPILLAVLVLFAIQSTFFGPIKYGILPQLLNEDELVGGNGMVEMATNLAILAGTILSEVAIAHGGTRTVSAVLICMSLTGFIASRFIPRTQAASPELRVNWNPIPPTLELFRLIRLRKSVYNSILAISWFWLLGGALLSLFPFYAKDVLYADKVMLTVLLAVFSVGVAVGSLMCEKLSGGRLELGLVPMGSIGMSVFLFDLWWIGIPAWPHTGALLSAEAVLATFVGKRVLFDLFAFSMFSGFFIVPLYTLIQQRTELQYRSRVIAGNNVMNALFMVVSSFALMGLLHMGVSIPRIFGLLAVGNALVALYVYSLIPEFFLRFLAYLLANFVYRMKVKGSEHIPEEGAVVLVCNHVSFADWMIILAGVRRPVHFVMWYTYFQMPVLNFLFKDAGAIPIASARLKPKLLKTAMERISEYLKEGEVVCIFPEGSLSKDGQLGPFKNGIERIVEDSYVPVVPMALRGLWGSNFSRHKGGFWKRFLKRPLRSNIELVIGPMILPEDVKIAHLREQILALRGDRL